MSQLNWNRKLAVAISREHVRSNRLMSSSQLYCFGNFGTIHEYALKFLIHKNFSHQAQLNRFIQMASAGGLIEKWRLGNRIRPQHTNEMKHYGIITMEQFYGIFMLLLAISVHLFMLNLIEKMVYKESRKPNPSCIWLLIEMVIDPYRHFWNKSVCFWK